MEDAPPAGKSREAFREIGFVSEFIIRAGLWTELSDLLRARVKTVATIGSAAEKIERQLAGVVKIVSAGTLEVAVRRLAHDAEPGDVVLLAPACSSFDQFDSYEHRGRVFKDLVKQLLAVTP